jgi:hypothetical protein
MFAQAESSIDPTQSPAHGPHMRNAVQRTITHLDSLREWIPQATPSAAAT